jgi:hypothetical protein
MCALSSAHQATFLVRVRCASPGHRLVVRSARPSSRAGDGGTACEWAERHRSMPSGHQKGLREAGRAKRSPLPRIRQTLPFSRDLAERPRDHWGRLEGTPEGVRHVCAASVWPLGTSGRVGAIRTGLAATSARRYRRRLGKREAEWWEACLDRGLPPSASPGGGALPRSPFRLFPARRAIARTSRHGRPVR